MVLNERFPEERVKFYAAQLVEAIDYCHSKNSIYKDLRPETICIDEDGNISIDFFSSSKIHVNNRKQSTIAGNPDYFAPELLNGFLQKENDWWSLGILTYEMTVGAIPFIHEDQEIVIEMIKTSSVRFPRHIKTSCELKDFVEQLTKKDPNERLGANGANEVREHPWFADINWGDIKRKTVEAPYMPSLVDQKKYFDPAFLKAGKSLEEDSK